MPGDGRAPLTTPGTDAAALVRRRPRSRAADAAAVLRWLCAPLVFAAAAPVYFFLPLLCEFASLLGYHAYLKMRYLLQMHYGAGALAIVIVIAAVFTAAQLHPAQKRKYS